MGAAAFAACSAETSASRAATTWWGRERAPEPGRYDRGGARPAVVGRASACRGGGIHGRTRLGGGPRRGGRLVACRMEGARGSGGAEAADPVAAPVAAAPVKGGGVAPPCANGEGRGGRGSGSRRMGAQRRRRLGSPRPRPGRSRGRGTQLRCRAEEGARLGELRRWMGKRGGAGGYWVEGPPREGWMSLPGRRRGSRWLWGWAGRRWLWGWEEKP
jgi:hypothetical protein